MKKKIILKDLKVESFVTELVTEKNLKGGTGSEYTVNDISTCLGKADGNFKCADLLFSDPHFCE